MHGDLCWGRSNILYHLTGTHHSQRHFFIFFCEGLIIVNKLHIALLIDIAIVDRHWWKVLVEEMSWNYTVITGRLITYGIFGRARFPDYGLLTRETPDAYLGKYIKNLGEIHLLYKSPHNRFGCGREIITQLFSNVVWRILNLISNRTAV